MSRAFYETAENFHPYECDGPRKCRHCDRRKTTDHDPATCALCDPEYDYAPNPHWPEQATRDNVARLDGAS
jgi:hypothetical protein